jgi:hypothetical protein
MQLFDPVTRDSGPADPAPLWLRLAGLFVACLGGALLAIVCAFFTPYRIGSVLVPVSLVLVVVGIVGLTWFAREVTDRPGLSLLPGGVWLVVSMLLTFRTAEGDWVLTELSWVPTVYLLLGSVTLGVLAFRMIVPSRR